MKMSHIRGKELCLRLHGTGGPGDGVCLLALAARAGAGGGSDAQDVFVLAAGMTAAPSAAGSATP